MQSLRLVARIALVVGVASYSLPSMATKKELYPLLVANAQVLFSAGLTVGGFGAEAGVKNFKNLCYFYGDGGYSMTVSDEVLSRYQQRGFSLNSLCLALVSGIRFDPESGKRLPTYILGDFAALKAQGNHPEVGVITEELPLVIPDCFKNGTPYSDCKMNFDPMTGKKHKPTTVAFYLDLGRTIEEDFKKGKAAGFWKDPCPPGGVQAKRSEDYLSCYTETETQPGVAGFLAREYWPDPDGPSAPINSSLRKYPSDKPLSWQHQSFVDVSANLPKGFGYALYAIGDAGNDPSADVLESAQSGSSFATSAEISSASESWK